MSAKHTPGLGCKGGNGPTRGMKATTFIVTFPDGTTTKKRDFHPPENPVGYAYCHQGKWYVAAIDEPDCARLSHYTQCAAIARAAGDGQ
jgi:hypothetical protein